MADATTAQDADTIVDDLDEPEGVAEDAVLVVSEEALSKVLEVRDAEDDAAALCLRVEIIGVNGVDFTYDLGFEPIADKWAAFGWFVQRVDGNDLDAVVDAFDAARDHAAAQPRVILLDTKMGRGVPFLEAREKNHFMQVAAAEWKQAIAHLDASHDVPEKG